MVPTLKNVLAQINPTRGKHLPTTCLLGIIYEVYSMFSKFVVMVCSYCFSMVVIKQQNMTCCWCSNKSVVLGTILYLIYHILAVISAVLINVSLEIFRGVLIIECFPIEIH